MFLIKLKIIDLTLQNKNQGFENIILTRFFIRQTTDSERQPCKCLSECSLRNEESLFCGVKDIIIKITISLNLKYFYNFVFLSFVATSCSSKINISPSLDKFKHNP